MNIALFPGQGSQHVGMGKFLFENFSQARHLFEEASDALRLDCKKLLFEGPESALQLTENTQPALVLVSAATYFTFVAETDARFGAGCGHSVGEYSALVASGALKLTDALRAVRARGQAMQEAVPVGKGAMVASIGLSSEQIGSICSWVVETSGLSPLDPANFNTPDQTVISGSQAAIDWLLANFDPARFGNPKRYKFIPLKVSAPFHCQLMKPAETKMEKVLSEIEFKSATFPIVQNVDAQESTDGATLRKKLVAQISKPVQWVNCMGRLKELGMNQAMEMGSGQVLSGLLKKIDESQSPVLNLNSLENFKKAIQWYQEHKS